MSDRSSVPGGEAAGDSAPTTEAAGTAIGVSSAPPGAVQDALATLREPGVFNWSARRRGLAAVDVLAREIERLRDPDYSPAYQDEYQRLWHRESAKAERLQRERDEAQETRTEDAETQSEKNYGKAYHRERSRADAALAERDRMEQERDEARAYAESQDWHTEWYAPMKARAEAAEAQAETYREALRLGLATAYADGDTKQKAMIARLCDDHLDRSGALLGEIRRAALAGEDA